MRHLGQRSAFRSAAVIAALTMGATACSSGDGGTPIDAGSPFLGLRSTSAPTLLQAERSCDEVLEDFQTFAPAVLRGQFGFGRDGVDFAETGAVAMEDAAGAPAADRSSAAPAEGAGAGGTSDTNTQEAGIDEPDVVETDGDFVYVVHEDQLIILDGSTADVVSRTPLATYGTQLLLKGDRLLAISGGFGHWGMGGGFRGGPIAVDVPAGAAVDLGDREAVGAGEVDVDPDEPVSDEPAGDDPATIEPVPEPIPGTEPAPGIEPPPAPAPEPQPTPAPEPTPEPEPVPGPIPVDPPRFQAGTVIQLIDVSDRRAPEILQTTEIEGNHVSTRVVGGVARVVVSTHPQPEIMPAEGLDAAAASAAESGDGEAFETAVAEALVDTTISDWLPSYRTTTDSESGGTTSIEGDIVECGDVLVPDVNAGITETSILRVDFTDGFDPGDTTTVVAEANTVYASASTLYIAANRWVSTEEQGRIASEDFATALHAFDLGGDGAATHAGAGEVPGTTLNQYSLSEHDGHLRIATTEGTPWDDRNVSESSVRVLRLEGGELREVGVVTGLGRTETIQSVRFMGPVGYVVTFRQTDPLYVIDLSDPAAPEAVGELKIPGFSSYLHPVGEGRLVGVGRDADLDGRDKGFLVSLFDVSDPTDPKQLQTYTVGDAWSPAGEDPKAFLWWDPESAAVLPIQRWTGERDASGMAVLDVADSGITERGMVRVEGRSPSRALVVQGALWSLFDSGVATSSFDDLGGATFHPYAGQ